MKRLLKIITILVILFLTGLVVWLILQANRASIIIIPTDNTSTVFFDTYKIGTGRVCVPFSSESKHTIRIENAEGQTTYEILVRDTSIEDVPKTQIGLEISFEKARVGLGCMTARYESNFEDTGTTFPNN